MNKYVINCEGMTKEDDFWDSYVSSVEIESEKQFGRNLDALWDALHAAGPGSPKDRECFISVRNTSSIKAIRGGVFYDHLRQIAYDLGQDPGNTIKFRVN